jgi:hypothetical protein
MTLSYRCEQLTLIWSNNQTMFDRCLVAARLSDRFLTLRACNLFGLSGEGYPPKMARRAPRNSGAQIL